MDQNKIEVTKKINKLTAENNKFRKELFTLKDQNNKLLHEIKLSNEENQKLKEQIIALENRISYQEDETAQILFERDKYYHQFKSLTKTRDKAPGKVAALTATVNEYKKKIAILEVKNSELKSHLKYTKNSEDYHSINALINKLKQKLSYKTLKYFGSNFNKLCDTIELMRIYEEEIAFVKETEQEQVEDRAYEERVGYVTSINNEIIFLDYNGETYKVNSTSVNIEKIIDMPVLCKIYDYEEAHVVSVYEETEDRKSQKAGKDILHKKDDSIDREKTVKKYKNKIKVLILGSKYKNEYTALLTKMNLEVTWFDAFEHSPKRIKDLHSSADIVIVCVRHIPHCVTDIVDPDEKKVCYLEQDTARVIGATVKYMIMDLGLDELELNDFVALA